jgi:hypothetical protein
VAGRAVLAELDQAVELLLGEDVRIERGLLALGEAAVLRVVPGGEAGAPVVVEARVERVHLRRALVGAIDRPIRS